MSYGRLKFLSSFVYKNHGLLSTSAGWRYVLRSTVPRKSVGEHYMDITTTLTGRILINFEELRRCQDFTVKFGGT